MKKTLLFCAALSVAITSMAQTQNTEISGISKANATMVKKRMANGLPKSISRPARVASLDGISTLAENQRYMGPYLTDDMADTESGIGLGAGTFKAAALIPYSTCLKYNGGKIVAIRYAVVGEISNPNVFVTNVVRTLDGNLQIGDDLATAEGSEATIGWNTVTFANPYTIDVNGGSNAALMIGYGFTSTDSSYPVSTYNPDLGSTVYLYGSYSDGSGEGWQSLGSDYGALSVQAIVEKDGGFHAIDAIMSDLSTPRYMQRGSKATVSWKCSTMGDDITSAKFGIKFNGKEAGEIDYSGDAIGFSPSTLTMDVDVPTDGIELGTVANMSVYVKKINGIDPDATYQYDDTVSTQFVPYTESFARQKQLVEFFTSQYASYGKMSDNVLTKLSALRDDIVKVGIHASLSTNTDQWYTSESDAIRAFCTQYVPTAAVNRYYYLGAFNAYSSVALSTAYTAEYQDAAATVFNTVIDKSNSDYPAFATVDIKSSYDSNTRLATVTVSGKRVSDFEKVMGSDPVLTVYLTHDNQKGDQLVGSSTTYSYVNNDVLRKILSGELGDAITWDGDTYTKTYEYTIPEDWTVTKKQCLKVVAFISRPITYEGTTFTTSVTDAWVTNANGCKLGEETTSGIADNVVDNTAKHEVARYALNGMRISAPQKGINIVKYSDGTTQKVTVE